jgi:hypothetical protein
VIRYATLGIVPKFWKRNKARDKIVSMGYCRGFHISKLAGLDALPVSCLFLTFLVHSGHSLEPAVPTRTNFPSGVRRLRKKLPLVYVAYATPEAKFVPRIFPLFKLKDNIIKLSVSHCVMPLTHVKWVPCHHGLARPQVADGGDGLQIWKVAANILNKQSRTADRGRSSNLGVGRGANTPLP